MSDRPTNLTATVTTATVTQGTATNLKTQAEAYQGGVAVSVSAPLQVALPAATVTTLTPPAAITGFATSAKQLADNHNVTVSNPFNGAVTAASLPLPTGASTSALQGGGLPAALGAGGGLKIDGSGTALPVSLASVPSHAVTNAGTFAVQPGSALTGPANPTVDSYASIAINLAAGADQSLVAAPGANKQIWVFGVNFTVNVAGTVSFQDEDNTAISGIMQFGATGGMAVSPSGNFSMPLWKVATNKALEVDVVTSELDGSLQYAIVSV